MLAFHDEGNVFPVINSGLDAGFECIGVDAGPEWIMGSRNKFRMTLYTKFNFQMVENCVFCLRVMFNTLFYQVIKIDYPA
jgi:hypothetical protein